MTRAKPRGGEPNASELASNQNARAWTMAAWAVFVKDAQIEGRTRHALGATLLFSVMTLAAISSALSASSPRADVKAALLWIVVLFAVLSGLSRAFVREEEAGTAPLLRIYAPPTAVFAGKWLFNLALTFLVELVSVPLFLIVLPPPQVNFSLFFGVLILGGFALSGAATFVAALIAQAASGRSALFFVVAFPTLMPLVIMATQATRGAFSAVPAFLLQGWNDVGLIAAYAVLMTTAALLLFEVVWRE